MTLYERRLDILRNVESGKLSIEDGSRLLEEVEMGLPLAQVEPLPASTEPVPSAPEVEIISPPMAPQADKLPQLTDLEQSRFNFWQKWWLLPFGIGVILTLLGAYWMYLGYLSAGLGWGFWLSWIPFGVGVLITALAARSRTARWLHVRVRETGGKDGRPHNINISLPLPISFGAWVLRTFGRWMPDDFNNQHLDEVLAMLDKALTKDAPLHVMVNEDDGDQVEVFIG
ncbi:MAG: hypothetical protein ABSE06_02000 [Anaerolineaceae bacterium]|jgi:hypothetical protein